MHSKLLILRAALTMLLTLSLISMTNAQCRWFAKIATGSTSWHSLGIQDDGSLWAWGYNIYGQLGNGTTTNSAVPIQISSDYWVSVAAGNGFSLGIKGDGTLWAWGDNSAGQLGDNTSISKNTPIQIGTDNNWASIAAGNLFSLAIKKDGTLWAWGQNIDGELGIGNNANKRIPTQVGTGTNWVSVSAGWLFSAGLKSDGTIWAWGLNNNAQLGDGTTTRRNAPVQIGAATNWISIAAGFAHCAGIKSDGTLWNWGGLPGGDINTPTQVGAATNWVSVIAGAGNSFAMKNDGTRWAWGDNSLAQLGDGTTVSKTTPVQIATANWALMGAGYGHCVSIKADGSLYGWGYNRYGQVGDGSTTDVKTGPRQTINSNFTLPVSNSSCQMSQDYFTVYSVCNLIASIVQTGGSTAITGNTSASVWPGTTIPAGYVKRHYQIHPDANANTATGRVTLYFTQQEFTDYNATNSQKLPIDGADAANNKKNLRIEVRGGVTSDGTGLPGSYSGTVTTIDPDDANIIWNATNSRWEITFDATGFGGFFVRNALNTLDKVGLTSSTPASPAYSLRLLSSSYTGYAIRVRRSNDNATRDIGFTANGDLDTSALKTFVGANDGYVTQWYDQSGNGIDAVQTTAASQPYLVKAGVVERINKRPAIYFGAANLATGKQTIFTNAASMVGVAMGNSTTPSAFITKTGTGAGANLNYPGPFDFTNTGGQFTVGNAAATAFNLIQPGSATPRGDVSSLVPESVYSFVIPATGTYYSYVNGIETGSQSVNAFTDGGNALMIGNRNDAGSYGNLWTPEIILFNSALSTTDRNTVEASQTTYYLSNSPLPLNWLSVKGLLTNNNAAQITWQVDEHQVQSYQIEKSNNGIVYNAIGYLLSKGDGTNTYSFTEPQILSGTGFYRIRQTDLDGRFTWSPVIKLTSHAVDLVTVFPNPATDLLTVTVGNDLINTEASMHDVNGRKIQSFTITARSFTISLASYLPGIYFLKTANGNVAKIVRK